MKITKRQLRRIIRESTGNNGGWPDDYVYELESTINKLEEENEKLKAQVEDLKTEIGFIQGEMDRTLDPDDAGAYSEKYRHIWDKK